MKKFILCFAIFIITLSSYSQEKSEVKYRRSSLHLMMIEDAKLPEKEIIVSTFNEYQDTDKSFPDKYNNHFINSSIIPYKEQKNVYLPDHPWVTRYELLEVNHPGHNIKRESYASYSEYQTASFAANQTFIASFSTEDKELMKDFATKNKEAKKAFKVKEKSDKKAQKELDKINKVTAEEKKRRKTLKDMKGIDKVIEKYFNDNKVANKLVSKWFNTKTSGMNFDLIGNRGSYDATELDVKIDKQDIKGLDVNLQDAGEELIDKTFVIANKFKFVENEVAALIAYELAKGLIEAMSDPKTETKLQKTIKNAALKKANQLYEKARKGYTVGTQAILYKLDWSKETQANFYSKHYIDSKMDEAEKSERLNKFNSSDAYQLQFIGMEKQTIRVLNLKKGDLSKKQIIDEATKRTMNKVYAKLQREYDVFKPKMPLLTAGKKDCTAKIGMKEGLEGGEKFEVLEMLTDEQGLTTYKLKGIIKVDSKQIWDNQFYASTGEKIIKKTEEKTEEKIEEKIEKKGKEKKGKEKKVKADTKSKETIITATGFKGCKSSYYAGMLIKQLK